MSEHPFNTDSTSESLLFQAFKITEMLLRVNRKIKVSVIFIL